MICVLASIILAPIIDGILGIDFSKEIILFLTILVGASIYQRKNKDQVYMQVDKTKKLFKNIGLIGGIIEIFFAGLVNSVYSNTRWPTMSGIPALWDFLFFSYSNPYALLSGVIFYLFFYRMAYNLEDIRAGKMDYVFIAISLCLIVWTYIIYTGILVYETL